MSVASASAFGASAESIESIESTESKFSISDLETVVVVSNRQGEPLRRVATSVTILDEAEIKARGLASLSDVLRNAPSVSVSNTGGMGKTTSLQIRGESGFRTLVLIDGIDISDPSTPQAGAHLQHVLSSNVRRVELLRGPQGMLYGADAGGVVDISTRSEEAGHRIDVATEAGSYNARRYNASASGSNDTLDYFVSAAKAYTGGFNTSVLDTELADKDGYNNRTLHGRVGWNLSEQWRLQAVVRDTDASSEFDRCGFPITVHDCVGEFSQQNARVSLAHNSESGQQELSYTRSDLSRNNYTEGAFSYGAEGDIQKLNLSGSADLSDSQAIIYGLEHREDTVGDLARNQWAAYSEYQGSYDERAFFTLGLRHDDSSDFGSHNSFRASTAYLFEELGNGAIKLKASYGTGFRAPSLFEVNYNRSKNNPALPILAPEESRGLDMGIEYFNDHGVHLELVLFDQIVENEIGYDWIGDNYLQGTGKSQSRGAELIGKAQLSDSLLLSANYTYNDAEAADDSPRPRRPKHLANLGFTYKPSSPLSVAVNLRYSDGAEDIDGSSMDIYHVLDASVRYQLNDSATVYVRGENLSDKDYVEVPGYNTAGLAAYTGVEFKF